jgi:hypothetical protein
VLSLLRQDFMEERDDKETRLAGLRLSISIALAVIIFALAVLAGLAWRRHSGSARLAHQAAALQQTVSIALQGLGPGALAAGNCAAPTATTCETGHICECLAGVETVLGNRDFDNGSLVYVLSIDKTSASLPVTNQENCLPATGLAVLSNTTGSLTASMDVSGLACQTADGAAEVSNGTYFITGGTTPGAQKAFSTGVGTISGGVNNGTAYVSLAGSRTEAITN